MKQKGQIILILLLIMTVALAIGLSVVQRSLSDVSSSSKVEQSSRAFSAAEAGVERAINRPDDLKNSGVINISANELQNFANADVRGDPAPDNVNVFAYERPDYAKEEIAQIWLQDAAGNPFPTSGKLQIYWGEEGTSDKPAIAVTVIYRESGIYKSQKFFYDSDSLRANNTNNFTAANCGIADRIVTQLSEYPGKKFFCTAIIDMAGLPNAVMLRARLLYTGTKTHPMAVKPLGAGIKLPTQGSVITSNGRSGETIRTIRLDKQDEVLPPWFDYVLFSVGTVYKAKE